jgi:hypothetical protein
MHRLALAAGLAWLVVAGYGVRETMIDGDGGWEVAYAVFSIALLVGAVLSVASAALATGESHRPRLRIAGLVVGGLGCALAIVGAWALPVWMTLLGIGFAVVAVAAGPGPRRALAVMAAGQLVGIVVLIAAIEAQVGTRDEHGDYPAAGGIAVVFVAVMAIVALVGLVRAIGRSAALRSGPTLALEIS